MPEIRIRPTVPGDLEALVDLETRCMHFPMGHRVREWFRDDFPFDYRDRFAVAEHEGRLVSAAALVPLPIRYRGIDLQAAYWEAVVTDENYRRQGLCRRLFARLTPARGLDALFVWGLTWLYRRLGYYPALGHFGGLGTHERIVQADGLPASSLTFRPATPNDAPFLAHVRAEAGKRYVVSQPASKSAFRHDLRKDRTVAGRGDTSLNRWQEWRILERDGTPVGYFMHDPWDLACLMELEIVEGETDWHEATITAVRGTADFPPVPCFAKGEVRATLPTNHPAYAALPDAFGPPNRHPDIAARIPDPISFLRKVAPALSVTGTDDLTLSTIEFSLRLRFYDGKVAVEPWPIDRPDEARVRLMPGKFEALVFGYRTIEEILDEDPDCHADEEAEAILNRLFPKGDSFLRPI